MNAIVKGVWQVRGMSVNQVDEVEHMLVTAGLRAHLRTGFRLSSPTTIHRTQACGSTR
jgi:hypothetical protein